MSDAKRKTASLVSEIDSRELAIRIIEKMGNIRRPTGITLEQAVAMTDKITMARAFKAAEAAMQYVVECINAGREPS